MANEWIVNTISWPAKADRSANHRTCMCALCPYIRVAIRVWDIATTTKKRQKRTMLSDCPCVPLFLVRPPFHSPSGNLYALQCIWYLCISCLFAVHLSYVRRGGHIRTHTGRSLSKSQSSISAEQKRNQYKWSKHSERTHKVCLQMEEIAENCVHHVRNRENARHAWQNDRFTLIRRLACARKWLGNLLLNHRCLSLKPAWILHGWRTHSFHFARFQQQFDVPVSFSRSCAHTHMRIVSVYIISVGSSQ